MGKVGFGPFAGAMDLGKHDLMVGTVQGAPVGDSALERAQLPGLIAFGMLRNQQGK
jgi:hypothetical protein